MRVVKTFLALAVLVLPACKKPKAESHDSGMVAMAGSGSAVDTGSAMAGSGSGSAMAAGSDTVGSGQLTDTGSATDPTAMAHRAGNCPSTVLHATTKAELKGKAVVVTITSDDKDAILAIQKRADELLKDKAAAKSAGDESKPGHDQKATHGGGIGICPVYVPEGATAKGTKLAKGVAVAITPKSSADELEKDIEGRITRAADWVKTNITPADKGDQGGVGGGSGDHGSNHSGKGDAKGKQRGTGGGKGTGGGGSKGSGGGGGSGG